MSENTGASIVAAKQYLQEVCDEVRSVSKVIGQRFNKYLPNEFAVHGYEEWPSQRPGSDFFDCYLYRINVKERRAKTANVGHATYIFDLGGANRLAARNKTALIVASWASAEEGPYDSSVLAMAMSRHKPLGRLMRWVDQRTKEPIDGAFLYAVPLTSVESESDVERLLIRPLGALASGAEMTRAAVDEAFTDCPEVLTLSEDAE